MGGSKAGSLDSSAILETGCQNLVPPSGAQPPGSPAVPRDPDICLDTDPLPSLQSPGLAASASDCVSPSRPCGNTQPHLYPQGCTTASQPSFLSYSQTQAVI